MEPETLKIAHATSSSVLTKTSATGPYFTRIADFDFGSDKPPDIIRNFILEPFEALFDFGDDRVGRKNDSIGMDGWLSKDEDNCHSP